MRRAPCFPPKRIPPKLHPSYQMRRPWNLDPFCVLCLRPEQGTKWVDYSGKANHGTISGATWGQTGRRGPALYFAGGTNLVNCGADSSLNISDTPSVCMWLKLANIAGSRVCFNNPLPAGTTNDWVFSFKPSNSTVVCGTPTDGWVFTYTGTGVAANVWIHFGWTYNIAAGTIQAYINGRAMTMVKSGDSYASAGSVLTIGGRGTTLNFVGWIDEVLIFNRLLTADEIYNIYRMGAP